MGSEQRRFDRVKASFEVAGRRAGALSETWRPATSVQMVRSELLAPGQYGCAAEFVEVTPDQQAAIDELVQFLRKPPVS